MKFKRTLFAMLSALASLTVLSAHVAHAAYPDRPIRLVVPYPAGGSTDVMARLIANVMSQHIGQRIVVENRAGAGTIVGMSNIAHSPPDGYHIVFTGATAFCIHPHVYNNLPYSNDDFTPIGFIAEAPVVFVGAKSVDADNLTDLVAHLRNAKEPATVATAGKGTFSHLTAAMFFAATGLTYKDVPYKGEAPALQDLISGHVPLYFGNLPGNLPHIESGRIKAFGVTSEERSPVAPNLPTFVEQGIPEVVTSAWFGIAAPKGVPDEVNAVLLDALKKALGDEKVLAQLSVLGAVPRIMSQQEFAQRIQQDYDTWGKVVDTAQLEKMEL